jgi:spore coat protein SA
VINLKIALICTEKLPVPPIAGGAVQLYIEGILPELSKHHNITVFGIEHPNLPNHEEVDGVKYVRVQGQSRSEYIRNVSLNLSQDFDLIHIFNRPRFVVRLSKDFPKVKFSLSLHNEMFHAEKIPIGTAVDCINRVEFICTVSKFIADGVKNLYPIAEDKLYPVYSGVNVNLYMPVMSEEGARRKERLKKKYNIEDKKVVLFVGRLSVKKGVDKLLNAMKKVMELRSDIALVVIGSKWYGKNSSDEYTESIEALSQKLKGPIVFTGFLPPSEIPEHYSLGDIFVCPSQWNEPLARVHYEAMAAGLPIITTNRGGNAEVVKGYGNGIIIEDYSNEDAFVNQIIQLMDNTSKASEMGQAGRALAEEKFTWERVADDLLKLFNMVEEKLSEEEQVYVPNREPVVIPIEEQTAKLITELKTKPKLKQKAKQKINRTINFNEKNVEDIIIDEFIELVKELPVEKREEIREEIREEKREEIREEQPEEQHKEPESQVDIKKDYQNKKVAEFLYATAEEEYYLKLYEDYLD